MIFAEKQRYFKINTFFYVLIVLYRSIS